MTVVRERVRVREPRHTSAVTLARPAVAGLVAVGAAFATLGIVLMRHSGLSFDETVYLSQVNPRVQTLFFSAPRSRGVPLVVAPVVWATSSVVALRCYLAVVTGAGLVAAYWPWLRVVRNRWLVPLAALLFAGLWIVEFYGSRAMPNMYVALGSVAAVGWLLRYVAERSKRALIGVAAGLAVAGLARPGDAFWLAVPLFVAVLAVRDWRRPPLLTAMVAGLLAGGGPWVVEAFVRFGGPLARLRRASQIEGGMGRHPQGLLMELHAIDGPTLCRPCTTGIINPVLSAWWLALPLIVAGGLVLAARASRLPQLALPAACGVSVAMPYALMVDYAAPRFLIPAYALFALPAAELVGRLVNGAPSRLRPVAAVAVVGILALHLAGQFLVVERHAAPPGRQSYPTVAARLRALGIRPPCTLSGHYAFPVAYYTGCRGAETSGHNSSISVAGLLSRSRREQVAILSRTGRPPAYARGWLPHRLTPGHHGWVAYLPP